MKFGRINPGLLGKACSIMDEWALLLSKHYSTGKPYSWPGEGMMKCCSPLLFMLCIKLPINRTIPRQLFVCVST